MGFKGLGSGFEGKGSMLGSGQGLLFLRSAFKFRACNEGDRALKHLCTVFWLHDFATCNSGKLFQIAFRSHFCMTGHTYDSMVNASYVWKHLTTFCQNQF